jgi:hypothetical protein
MTTETPASATPGDQGTPTAPAAPDATSTQTAPATSALTDGNIEQKPAEPAADTTGEKPAEEGKKPEAQGAPEAYDIKVPEGITLDEASLGEFTSVFKELNLTQEQAQRLADVQAAFVQKQNEATAAQFAQWQEASKTDKEFGGDKLQENLAVGKKALDTFFSPDVKQMLVITGLGNHPEVIRGFIKIGKQLSDDSVIRGSGTSPQAARKDTADVLYGNTKT